GNDNENEQKSKKKPKPSGGIVERVRRGRAKKQEQQPAPSEPVAAAPARRSSSRRASAKLAAEKIAGGDKKSTTTTKKEAAAATAAVKKETAAEAAKKKAAPKKVATKKAATKKAAAPAKKEATKKKGGTKRSSSGGDDGDKSKTRGRSQSRTSKRAKKSDSTTTVVSAEPRRTTRSRSRSVAAKKKKERVGVVDIIPGDENHIVPLDFRLQRESFNDGQNFTYGIAHYDAAERSDPNRCKDYVTDMFQHYFHLETESHPRPYMDRQDDITAKMRAILVDWLVEVHMKFRLAPETLYLCVHIIDRYCSIEHVPRSKLQLVGVTALFLATKHEEIYPPEVRDCVYITDRAYDRQEVLDMEQTILRVLDWKISLPTAYPFLDRFLSLTDASPLTRHAATYYLERTLQEYDLLKYRPSLVCASIVILALNNPDIRVEEEDYERELPGLPRILMEYTEFDQDELMACMDLCATKICEPAICASRRHLTAVRKKYENRKYLSVSTVIELPSMRYVRLNMRSDE
ncbi:hypothetical protein ACHAXR_005593, partial [Thalassiosira sp. AJA248-18]